MSFGANEHGLLCCDAHVSFLPEVGKNYDILVEVSLTKGRDVPSALAVLETYLADTPTWAGNLVLSDGTETACVEARGTELRVLRSDNYVSKSNHQDLFESSRCRLDSSSTRLADVRCLDDILTLLKSNDQGGTGICNHLAGRRTVYSYILHVKSGVTTLHVAKALPCQTDEYQQLVVPFSRMWSDSEANALIENYPG